MESEKTFGDIVTRCWKDPAFKARFVANPKAVLAEYDIPVPNGLTVRVVENTSTEMFITLPPAPHTPSAELSDHDLDAVSGGASVTANSLGTRAALYHAVSPGITPVNTSDTSSKSCVPW